MDMDLGFQERGALVVSSAGQTNKVVQQYIDYEAKSP
jgi:hypothetical protein